MRSVNWSTPGLALGVMAAVEEFARARASGDIPAKRFLQIESLSGVDRRVGGTYIQMDVSRKSRFGHRRRAIPPIFYGSSSGACKSCEDSCL